MTAVVSGASAVTSETDTPSIDETTARHRGDESDWRPPHRCSVRRHVDEAGSPPHGSARVSSS